MSQIAPITIDVDGYEDPLGIRYVGTATRQVDGTYRTSAVILGCECVVRCNEKFIERATPAETEG